MRLSFLQEDVSLVTMRVPEREPEHKAKKKGDRLAGSQCFTEKKNTAFSGDIGRLNAGKCLTMQWKYKERHFEVEIEQKYIGK